MVLALFFSVIDSFVMFSRTCSWVFLGNKQPPRLRQTIVCLFGNVAVDLGRRMWNQARSNHSAFHDFDSCASVSLQYPIISVTSPIKVDCSESSPFLWHDSRHRTCCCQTKGTLYLLMKGLCELG